MQRLAYFLNTMKLVLKCQPQRGEIEVEETIVWERRSLRNLGNRDWMGSDGKVKSEC